MKPWHTQASRSAGITGPSWPSPRDALTQVDKTHVPGFTKPMSMIAKNPEDAFKYTDHTQIRRESFPPVGKAPMKDGTFHSEEGILPPVPLIPGELNGILRRQPKAAVGKGLAKAH
jgi:hypothetical protein